MAVEREGLPFLVLRDGDGAQRIVRLLAAAAMTVGRSEQCDLALPWDGQVSRVHAELVNVGGDWALEDGGLSRNGSYVNGERLSERRRLADGDTLRFGHTEVLFRAPAVSGRLEGTTLLADSNPGPVELSPAQRAVMRALCRPFAGGAEFARPATNQEIAAELVLSLEGVKGHLRVLFAKFDLTDLPQNEKRLRLAERAIAGGTVSLAELRDSRPEGCV